MDEANSDLNNFRMNELDIFTLPLKGKRLIEASAGTGKTYSITLIYLRLLLNLGSNNFNRPLSVREILVVTFTNAATEELRNRIRTVIIEMKAIFQNKLCDHNSDLYKFVELANKQQKDHSELIKLLIEAEQSMDESSIYTIDGFSLKMFKQFSLLLKETDELDLLDDQEALLLDVIRNFWRKYFYPIKSTLLVDKIHQELTSPNKLCIKLTPFLQSSALITILKNKPINTLLSELDEHYKTFQIALNKIKITWKAKNFNVLENILNANLNARTYSEDKILDRIAVIDKWSEDPLDLNYPNELIAFHSSKLHAKTKKESDLTKLKVEFYTALEEAHLGLPQYPNLFEFLFESILSEVYAGLEYQKKQNQQFTHGDPLKKLVFGLNDPIAQPILTQSIRDLFPVALIDEFQDTDELQYQFFDEIYRDKNETGLILIGDPKQAIYGFRGGDIFTYIKAKQQADSVYSIKCNWRSSDRLIEAVNAIFESDSAFKYDEIPFQAATSAAKNKSKKLSFNSGKEAESGFEICSVDCSEEDFCAAKISAWLTQPAYLEDNDKEAKAVQASDIAVLVQNGKQAQLIQTALNKYNISSSYFSNRESVFKSIEATWILYLFDAILNQSNLSKISLANATPLFNLTMFELQMIQEEGRIEELVQHLNDLENIYQKSGIYVMLQTILTKNHIAETLLQMENGNRHLTNLLHLSELLQTASQSHQSLHTLSEWFKIQMDKTTSNSKESIQRLDNDENVVKIYTLHGSKGLEFPIVCLPFIFKMDTKKITKPFVYHDENYTLCLAVNDDEKASSMKQKEDEAELIRLAYVAMTRPVYHCLAILNTNEKSSLVSGLLSSDKIKTTPCTLEEIIELAEQNKTAPEQKMTQLKGATLTRAIASTWKMNSYSSLLHRQGQIKNELNSQKDDDEISLQTEQHNRERILSVDESENENPKIILHDFPYGSEVGKLFHTLIEHSKLSSVLEENLIEKMLQTLNLDRVIYAPIIQTFYQNFINTPLDESGFTLSDIHPKKQLDEFYFLLPIQKDLTAMQLNRLMKKFDPLSKSAPELHFETLKGMLHGFIDLVFEYDGRYYIADYKSNYLGDHLSDYDQAEISKAMIDHRYDLQYQLYTLALHRYLRLRLPNYDYEKDFGGIFYLFLRGMNGDSKRGVYFYRPAFEFVQQLDQLFAK